MVAKTSLLLLISLFFFVRPEEEDDVVILTDDNLEQMIKDNPIMMVKFYAPWCGHCKAFAPEYAIAAKKGKAEGIILGKLDATVHHKAAQTYQIQGFPTIKLFLNGEPISYEGERKADPVLDWIKKKKTQTYEHIEAAEGIEQLKKKDSPSIVLFVEPDDQVTLAMYAKLVKKSDDFNFYVFQGKTDQKIVEKYPSIIMYKNYDEETTAFTGPLTNPTEIVNFFVEKAVPVMGRFTEKLADAIFRDGNNGLLIFAENSFLEPMKKEIYNLALKNKGSLVFTLSGVKEGMEERLANFVGVKQEDLPVVYIISDTRGTPTKYKLKKPFTAENLERFIAEFNEKKLSPYFKSEPVPEVNNGPVIKVVADNFKDIVLNSANDVLVKFYAPWCGHCKQFAPIYEAYAKKLMENGNQNIVLAEMDATANEVKGVEIKSYPTIKFYGKKSKTSPIEYKEDRSEIGLTKFLQENSAFILKTEKAAEKIPEKVDDKVPAKEEEIKKKEEL
jgi:protein disulfide-isomerase A1